jgi:PAS domain S-box-containing protein
MNQQPTTAFVVNDDPTQLKVLAGLLQKKGIDTATFESAEAALAEMNVDQPPDLIVTDLYMPGIDGWRFCRLLRSPDYKAFNTVPILVVSATFAGDHPERIATDIGADFFLPSPVDGKEFLSRVRALLQGNEVRRLPRALIVEDCKTLAGILKKSFNAHGYRTDATLTAREAREAFARRVYDVAVLDYHLPDGTGDVLLDVFQAGRPDCACLMMTTDMAPELSLSWMKRGASAYLHKPFEPEYLIELCARARRERALLRTEELLEARTRELRESETRYRAFFEGIRDAAFVHEVNETGEPERFIDVNEAACRRLGYTRKELLSMAPRDIADPAEYKRLSLGRYELEDRRNILIETIHVAKDGRKIPVEGNIRRTTYLGRSVALSVSRDITERRLAEAEKEKLKAQLLQAQKMESVGRLAGGVAHDFNNMLGVILGHAELALLKAKEDNDLISDLEEIQKAAKRSADITKQLLAFARKQPISPRQLDLNDTIESMLDMLRRLIGEDIDLVWKPSPHLWYVKMDPSQIDQILANLCINAKDAIDGVGKLTIETGRKTFDDAYCKEHAGFIPGDFVLLAVSDNGCGMDKNTLDNLFEPFFTTKEMGKGTGLGLATIYGIVKQNNGFINIYSEPGQGSTFKIYLPRLVAEENTDKAVPEKKPAAGGTETILLVEDEPTILRMTRMMLERKGYRVLSAATPTEAVEKAKNHSGPIDMLMTDVVMPEMNGRDLSGKITDLYPGIRLLFMSGYTANVIAHHGVLDDGLAFIQKPFSMAEMAAKIREVLDKTSY